MERMHWSCTPDTCRLYLARPALSLCRYLHVASYTSLFGRGLLKRACTFYYCLGTCGSLQEHSTAQHSTVQYSARLLHRTQPRTQPRSHGIPDMARRCCPGPFPEVWLPGAYQYHNAHCAVPFCRSRTTRCLTPQLHTRAETCARQEPAWPALHSTVFSPFYSMEPSASYEKWSDTRRGHSTIKQDHARDDAVAHVGRARVGFCSSVP